MTKSGANGPKGRARARQERDGVKYTQARRGGADGGQGPRQDPHLSFAAWEAPRTWRCHHCGAHGEEFALTHTCHYVLADGVTYLRPHCPQCLPEPATDRFAGRTWQDPKAPEWERYDDQARRRSQALAEAVRAGAPAAYWTDLYRCSVCGTAWQISPRVRLPCGVLYDRSTDLFEHPCPQCSASLSEAELGRAHQQRSRQL